MAENLPKKGQNPIGKDIEPNSKPNRYVRRDSRDITQHSEFTIADMVLGVLNRYKEEKLSNYELRSRIKKFYRKKVNEDSIRITCNRLANEDKIEKTKKGHNVLYQHKLTQDEYLEEVLSKSIQVKEWEIPKLHKTSILFPIKRAKRMGQPNKSKGSPPVPLAILQNPQLPESISKRWKIPDSSKLTSINGGFQEELNFEKARITAQIYYNGSFQIHSNFSDDPKDIRLWLQYLEFLNGFFYARCGYYLKDFQELLEVRYETNIDQPLDSVNTVPRTFSNDSSGKYCVTLRQFNALARVYTKKIGDEEFLRTEVGNEEGMPFKQFISEQLAMINGGINSQVLIRLWHETSSRLEQQGKAIENLGNAVKFLMLERNKAKRPRKAATKKPKKAKVPGGCFCP